MRCLSSSRTRFTNSAGAFLLRLAPVTIALSFAFDSASMAAQNFDLRCTPEPYTSYPARDPIVETHVSLYNGVWNIIHIAKSGATYDRSTQYHILNAVSSNETLWVGTLLNQPWFTMHGEVFGDGDRFTYVETIFDTRPPFKKVGSTTHYCVARDKSSLIIKSAVPIFENFGTAVVKNNSCSTVDSVSIDGKTVDANIGPGKSAEYPINSNCNHLMRASSVEIKWNNAITCDGSPYVNYQWNLVTQNNSSDELPVDSIIAETYPANGYVNLSITSKMDCISIDRLVANRGNCSNALGNTSAILKFGQTIKIPMFCDRLLELKISTDHGVGTLTWDR